MLLMHHWQQPRQLGIFIPHTVECLGGYQNPRATEVDMFYMILRPNKHNCLRIELFLESHKNWEQSPIDRKGKEPSKRCSRMWRHNSALNSGSASWRGGFRILYAFFRCLKQNSINCSFCVHTNSYDCQQSKSHP